MIILSIRPVDLKMAIPKTQEVSKVEQNNNENLKFSLQNQVDEQNKTIKQEMKQVNDSEELSKSKIRDNEDKNNSKEDKEDQKKESKASQLLNHDSKEGNVGKDSTVGGKIDIKV